MTLTETYCQPVAAIHGSHYSPGYQVSSSKLFVPEITARKPSKLAWTGSDLTPLDYIVSLNDDDLSDIKSAIRDFKGLDLPIPHVSPENFTLSPELAVRLRRISDEVHHGRGFCALRGLDPSQFVDAKDKVIAFCGLSSYIGTERGTNQNRLSMIHIRSTEFDQQNTEEYLNTTSRPLERPHALRYHSDRFFGDVLALYVDCLGESGGDQYLASFQTIRNCLLRETPAALKLLATPDWPCLDGKSHDDVFYGPNGNPIVFENGDRSIIQLVHKPFEGAGKDPLSTEQRRALDEVQRTAEKVSIKLDREVGDIQFINNLALLHARDDYVDTPENVRCYMRLGLRDKKNAWKKPASHREEFDERFATPVEDQYIPVRHDEPLPPWYKPSRMSHG